MLVPLFLLVSLPAVAAPTPFDPLGESMPLFSAAVSWWINWLIVIGISSILFAWKHVGARWVLGAYVANHAVLISLFFDYRDSFVFLFTQPIA